MVKNMKGDFLKYPIHATGVYQMQHCLFSKFYTIHFKNFPINIYFSAKCSGSYYILLFLKDWAAIAGNQFDLAI